MDRKSFIILVFCFLFLMLWGPFVNWMFPPTKQPPSTNTVSQPLIGSLTNTNVLQPSFQPAAPLAPASTTPPSFVQSGEPEQIVEVQNEKARYFFSSHGGLKRIELKDHYATVPCGRNAPAGTNNFATLNDPSPVPILTLLGPGSIQDGGAYAVSESSGRVLLEKSLTNGLHIVKEFQLGSNYMMQATVRLENRSGQPVSLPPLEWVVGTATPMGQRDESLMMGLQWYNGAKTEDVGESWFQNHAMGCACLPGTPRSEYAAGAGNVGWASVHNQFFAIAMVPDLPAPRVVARRIDLPPPSKEALAEDSQVLAKPYGFQTSLLYPGEVLEPGAHVERRFEIYAGPKEYNTLARLGHNLDLIMRFGFFGFFAKALLLSMNGLAAFNMSYGVAIVVITIIIKLLFWPLTTASTRSMKRMAALQPQMKALQEKYKDDPKKMNLKLMEFMKENKVSPLAGCLPMLLQIPVFIGFFEMLRSAIELRGARFLWACDLSQPDTIWTIPGLGFPVNPMPLLMGATMLWQARMTPPSPGMDPVQQKILKYMPLIFMVFLYNFSAGLTLYWTVQNLLTIAQMKLTKTSDPQPAPAAKPQAPAPKLPPPKKKPRP